MVGCARNMPVWPAFLAVRAAGRALLLSCAASPAPVQGGTRMAGPRAAGGNLAASR